MRKGALVRLWWWWPSIGGSLFCSGEGLELSYAGLAYSAPGELVEYE